MKRVAAYAGTRNVYPAMAAAAKSLMRWTWMDRIIFLIEDDTFPEELPDVIQTINMAKTIYFDKNGPNYKNSWTYMTMARLALHRLLPDEDRVLYLDVDTIVQFDISELFDVDMQGNVIAGCKEGWRCREPFVYFNAGVLLMDLKRLRDGIGDEMLRMVNTKRLNCVDQDTINLLCQGRILELNPIYNANDYTMMPMNAKICHFAGDHNYTERKLFKEYLKMKWSDINACKE